MSKNGKGTALVTGGAVRIGRAIATGLADEGYRVVIHYHGSADEADKAVEELHAQFPERGKPVALQADLSNEDEAGLLIGRAVEAAGPLAVLVNNASLFGTDDFENVTKESWDNHLATNLRAPLVLSKAFAAALNETDLAEGNIVNMLDQRVWRLTPRFLSYTVSKSALWTLTQTMAMALAPRIRVNGIGPGPTLANERQDLDAFRRQQEATILGRGAELSEIAAAVRFILASPSMTGQMIALDGGQHLAWETPDVVGVPE